MVVADLIENLKKYDQNLEVIMEAYDGYLDKIDSVEFKQSESTAKFPKAHVILNPIL
jgi:hypothetical protein